MTRFSISSIVVASISSFAFLCFCWTIEDDLAYFQRSLLLPQADNNSAPAADVADPQVRRIVGVFEAGLLGTAMQRRAYETLINRWPEAEWHCRQHAANINIPVCRFLFPTKPHPSSLAAGGDQQQAAAAAAFITGATDRILSAKLTCRAFKHGTGTKRGAKFDEHRDQAARIIIEFAKLNWTPLSDFHSIVRHCQSVYETVYGWFNANPGRKLEQRVKCAMAVCMVMSVPQLNDRRDNKSSTIIPTTWNPPRGDWSGTDTLTMTEYALDYFGKHVSSDQIITTPDDYRDAVLGIYRSALAGRKDQQLCFQAITKHWSMIIAYCQRLSLTQPPPSPAPSNFACRFLYPPAGSFGQGIDAERVATEFINALANKLKLERIQFIKGTMSRHPRFQSRRNETQRAVDRLLATAGENWPPAGDHHGLALANYSALVQVCKEINARGNPRRDPAISKQDFDRFRFHLAACRTLSTPRFYVLGRPKSEQKTQSGQQQQQQVIQIDDDDDDDDDDNEDDEQMQEDSSRPAGHDDDPHLRLIEEHLLNDDDNDHNEENDEDLQDTTTDLNADLLKHWEDQLREQIVVPPTSSSSSTQTAGPAPMEED